ncbi:MAG TPA: hypothetical protein ENJ92_00440 [Chloroflexi bacterium]|nr:hypothetical protein [Chloroflexota bacterium]
MMSGDKFPPIVLLKGTHKLLDGYHRWKAVLKWQEMKEKDDSLPAPPSEMDCEYHAVPEGVPPKLYAISLSARHGLRPSAADRKRIAREVYQSQVGLPTKVIARYLGVSAPTAANYVKDLVAEFEETKRSVIMRLDMLGWAQEEISSKLKELFPVAKGASQDRISHFLRENEDFNFRVKNDLDKGLTSQTIAQRYNLPEILVWALKLQGKSDQERMGELGIKIQPYDVWNFARCHELFGGEYPGRIPGELVAHVLYFFTESGMTVLDPMAGSGTVPDVCLAMGRKCYAYDIDGRAERPDILRHDLKTGWPERIKKVNLIFWDPPYFEKKDKEATGGKEGYIADSISGLDRDEYLAFFAQRLREVKQLAKKGTKLALLMSDWDDNTGEREGLFVWDYADLLRGAGLKIIRHIQVPLPTQLVHPDIVKKFRVKKRLARLERYLLIAEV